MFPFFRPGGDGGRSKKIGNSNFQNDCKLKEGENFKMLFHPGNLKGLTRPKNKSGEDLCLRFHCLGYCFSDCKYNGGHGSLSRNEKEEVVRFVNGVREERRRFLERRKKGNKKKRVEALLAYHQRLVEEKGLPPSRLMLQQAAAPTTSTSASVTLSQSPGRSEIPFKCDLCDFSSKSKRGLKVHTGRSHKEKDQQMPVESLRCEEHENSLDISQLSQTRDKDSSLVNADHSEFSPS